MTRQDVHVRVPIDDDSGVGSARREVARFFTKSDQTLRRGRAELAVTELATNILSHAGKGEILLRSWADGCCDVFGIDRGPGMADVDLCLEDGFSTTGTSGTGLGAIARLPDVRDIASTPGRGTVIWLGWHTQLPVEGAPYQLGAVCRPLPGETMCGDGWIWDAKHGRLIVIDGLGHGPRAAQVASEARRWTMARGVGGAATVEGELAELHTHLQGTRGAAVTLAQIDRARSEVTVCGVGNVDAVLVEAGETYGFPIGPGVVGNRARRMTATTRRWSEGAILVLATDGVRSRWSRDLDRRLLARPSQTIAATLYRDYARGSDDACVVCVRLHNDPAEPREDLR